MFGYLKAFFAEFKGTLLFVCLMMIFRSSFADFNHVPTGSMKPTILEGDRIGINKLAYDIQIPFTDFSIAHIADPERGDIIVFNSKASNNRLVKRVIGIPGDRVSMHSNRLSINEDILPYKLSSELIDYIDLNEKLIDKNYTIRVNKKRSQASTFDTVLVPENHYLVLGDNRDNSADSRFIGFVPRHEIIGKSSTVVFSLNPEDYYLPRGERLFKTL